MQRYTENSPEAMAQLLTALMAADERIDDAEIEALSAHSLDELKIIFNLGNLGCV